MHPPHHKQPRPPKRPLPGSQLNDNSTGGGGRDPVLAEEESGARARKTNSPAMVRTEKSVAKPLPGVHSRNTVSPPRGKPPRRSDPPPSQSSSSPPPPPPPRTQPAPKPKKPADGPEQQWKRAPMDKGRRKAPAATASSSTAAEPPVLRWRRPDWDRTEHLEDRRPAGVFVLQHKVKKVAYWGTGWDLDTVRKEQFELLRTNTHPDRRLNNEGEEEGEVGRKKGDAAIEFVVVREMPLPPTFALGEFEARLGKAMKIEFDWYRRSFTERLVQLYKFARLRVALRIWYKTARRLWLREQVSCVIEVQRIVRSYLVRRRLRRHALRIQEAKARQAVASWGQRYYRGHRDRAKVSQALEFATRKRTPGGPIGSRLYQVVRHDKDKDGLKYKIKRLQYLEKKPPAPAKPKPAPQVSLLVHPEHNAMARRNPDNSYAPSKQHHHQRAGVSNKNESHGTTAMTALKSVRATAMPQVICIQRFWRGHQARLFVQAIYKSLRNHRIRRERAADHIQMWYRSCILMREAMNQLVDLKYEKQCCIRIQKTWRGHRGRRRFQRDHGQTLRRRRHGAVTVQRFARGFLARKLVRYMKDKVFRFRMAVRVAQFFRSAQSFLVDIRAMILDKRNRAALRIQTRVRILLARRRVRQRREAKRQEAAAQKIQLAYHRHRYRVRCRSRYCLQIVGACDMCVGAKAAVYVEYTEQKLCQSCYRRTMEIITSKGLPYGGRAYGVRDYRRESAAAGIIQQAYRRSITYKIWRFGPCLFCSKRPVRLYCMECKYRTCRSCSWAVHSVTVLRQHAPMTIELLLKQKHAAAVVCLFWKENFERFKLQKRFGNNYRARRIHAAKLMQSLFRGHYTRRVFALYSYVAYSMGHLLAQQSRFYPLWATYTVTVDRVTRFINPSIRPQLSGIRSSLGYGPLTRVVRKRAALCIERMLVHHKEYKRARRTVNLRRKSRDNRRAQGSLAREQAVSARITAAVLIQRIFRGYASRLVCSANRQARMAAIKLVVDVCDMASLQRRAQAIWSIHKGYLGMIRLNAIDVWSALSQAGVSIFPLSALGRRASDATSTFRDPDAGKPLSHALVGGNLHVAFSVRPYQPTPPYRVIASRLAPPGTTKSLDLLRTLPSFCVHQSQASASLPHQPPSVLKVQLAGVCEYKPGGQPNLNSLTRYACKLWLWGEPICSSTRSVPVKVEPSFHDEILYVSLLGSRPLPNVAALKIEVYEIERPGLPLAGGGLVGFVALDAIEVLRLLGQNSSLPLEGTQSRKSFRLCLTLSLEAATRTESRLVATSIVRLIRKQVREALDFRTPRIELRLLHALIPEPQEAARGAQVVVLDPHVYTEFCLQVEWKADGSEARTVYMPYGHKLTFPEGSEATHLTFGVPDDYPEEEWEVRVALAANNAVAQDLVVAVGCLRCRDLYQPEAKTLVVHLRQPTVVTGPDGGMVMGPVPEEGPVVAKVSFDVSARFVSRPFWRRRLDFCDKVVKRMIRQGIDLVPQPRIELRLHELSDVTTRAQNLTIDVYWGRRYLACLREQRRVYPDLGLSGQESLSITTRGGYAKATIVFERSRICLFFAQNHRWKDFAPDLRLVVRGTVMQPQDTYLGEICLQRHDVLLLPVSRAAQLPLVEPVDASERGVVRKVAGVVTCSFLPVDIPATAYPQLRLPYPRLCIQFLDIRHEALHKNQAITQLVQGGVHCRILWKGVEVGRTMLAEGPSHPTFRSEEVFMIPIRSEAEHHVTSPTLPLFIQLFRRVVDKKHGDKEELIGEVVPFNGVPRTIPTNYYPFDIHAALGGKREGKVIGQLGLGIWMHYLDVDKARSLELMAETLQPYDEEEDEPMLTADDVHAMATAGVTHEKARRYSYISALAKTEKEAMDMYVRAKEVADVNPHDTALQQYVRLMGGEYDRASRALKAAKLKGAEVQARAAAKPVVEDLFLGITTKTVKQDAKSPRSPTGAGALQAAGNVKRKQALSTVGAKKPSKAATQTASKGGRHQSASSPRSPSRASAKGQPTSPSRAQSPRSDDEGEQDDDKEAPRSPAAPRFRPAPSSSTHSLTAGDHVKSLLADPRLSPPVPALRPSVYLKIRRATGIHTVLKAAPSVRVMWCGVRVATTQLGKAVSDKAGAFSWDEDEAYLLPLPAAVDTAKLHLEVWTTQEFCGQVAVEADQLTKEYVDPNGPDAAAGHRLELEHQLMPKESNSQANKFGVLHFYVVNLHPVMYKPLAEEMVTYVVGAMEETVEDDPSNATLLQQAKDLAATSEGGGQLNAAHLTYIQGSYLKNKYTLKLQVLAGGSLPKGWGMDETDPFLVLLLNDKEVARTKAMQDTMEPVFPDAIFDLPLECITEEEDGKHNLVLQLYDANTLTSNVFLGTMSLTSSDLRRMLHRVDCLPIVTTKPKKTTKDKQDEPEPWLNLSTHVLPRPPGESRIELRILNLHLPSPVTESSAMSTLASSKRTVEAEIWWNENRVAVLQGSVWSSSPKTTLSKSVVDLPFDYDDIIMALSPNIRHRRLPELPANLQINFYEVIAPEQRRFLGQMSASGPFGMLVEEEESHLLGAQYSSATYRLVPKPDMLIDSPASPARGPGLPVDAGEVAGRKKGKMSTNPLDVVGGRCTCQFVMCDPSETAHDWLQAARAQREKGPKARVHIKDAVNLGYVTGGVLNAKYRPSPYAVVYFNNREIYRTANRSETTFPLWEDEAFDVSLHGYSQSPFHDHASIEVYHGTDSSSNATLLGGISLTPKQLYEPRVGQKLDHQLDMPPFGAALRRQREAQGLMSLVFELLAPAAPGTGGGGLKSIAATPLVVSSQQNSPAGAPDAQQPSAAAMKDAGFRPQRWVRLSITRATGLRKADKLGKSGRYCLLLWNRRTQFTTSVARKSTNPSWNQKIDLPYDASEDMKLADLELRIMVLNKDAVGGVDTFMGQVVLTGSLLLHGRNKLQAYPLQPRHDVPQDRETAAQFAAAKLYLSFRPMEELPFAQSLSSTQLMLFNPYMALEVVQFETQADLQEEGEEEGEDTRDGAGTAPTFFVQVNYNGNAVARTACVRMHRGEGRFDSEVFVFSNGTKDARTAFRSSFKNMSFRASFRNLLGGGGQQQQTSPLEQSDFDAQVRLEVFGLFPKSSRKNAAGGGGDPSVLGPSLHKLGYLDLSAKDFLEPPLYQARRPLVSEAGLLTSATGAFGLRGDSLATRLVRARSSLSVRLAFIKPSPPRAFRRPLTSTTTNPRLRLEIYGVAFVPPEDGADAVHWGEKWTQWPWPDATYAVDTVFCRSSSSSSLQVPLLQEATGSQEDLTAVGGGRGPEYLLDLPHDSKLKDVSLSMKVTQKKPYQGQDGTSQQEESCSLGEVNLTWSVLSKLPMLASTYALSELERTESTDAAHHVSATYVQDFTGTSGQGSASSMRVFQSRLVYAQQHVSVTTAGTSTTPSSNRVSSFCLLYGLRLELPTKATTAAPRPVWDDDEEALSMPFRHITEQGFDCEKAGGLSHGEESLSRGPLTSRFRSQESLHRRLRLAVTQVYVKRTSLNRHVLKPVQAGCLVSWRGQIVSTLMVSASRHIKAERDATCYLPLGPETNNHDLSMVIVSQATKGTDEENAPPEQEEDECSGMVFLPWERLCRLPWNRTDYHVLSGDEHLYDSSAYTTIQLETLRDGPNQQQQQKETRGLDAILTGKRGNGVRQLGEIVVALKLCLETSRTGRPFHLELQPLHADSLAPCNREWGASRVPGVKKRNVYTVVKQGQTLWHTTGAAVGQEDGRVDLSGPKAALPLQTLHPAEVTVTLHDFGTYSARECRMVVRIQKLVRCWVARRRVALLRLRKRLRWQRWCASTTIVISVKRWLLLQKNRRAALTLQRVVRGHTIRNQVQAMVRSSTITIRLYDLRYVAIQDDSVEGKGRCPMHCVVTWGGKVVKRFDVPVTLAEGCRVDEEMECTLKRVLKDDQALCCTVKGVEHYLVGDEAWLTVTLIKRASAPTYQHRSPDWHVATLSLDKHKLTSISQVVDRHARGKDLNKSYFNMHFDVMHGDADTTQEDVVMRAVANLEKSAKVTTAMAHWAHYPNFAVFAIQAEADRPLWDSSRAAADHQRPSPAKLTTPQSVEAVMDDVIDDVLDRAIRMARSKQLTIRIAGLKDLSSGGASLLSPWCIVTWEGKTLATIKLTYRDATSSWVPADMAAGEAFICLTPPTCINPEAMVMVYHDGLHGKLMLAAATLALDDLMELRRRGAGQVAATGPGSSSLLEVFLDVCINKKSTAGSSKAWTHGGSDVTHPLLEVGVYFTASVAGVTARPVPSSRGNQQQVVSKAPASTSMTQRRSSLMTTGKAQEASPAKVASPTSSSSSKSSGSSQHKASTLRWKDTSEDKKAGGSDWAAPSLPPSSSSPASSSLSSPASSSTRHQLAGRVLEFDGERKLHYFIDQDGQRVYQIPTAALQQQNNTID